MDHHPNNTSLYAYMIAAACNSACLWCHPTLAEKIFNRRACATWRMQIKRARSLRHSAVPGTYSWAALGYRRLAAHCACLLFLFIVYCYHFYGE